jgi:hypothetical protein
MAEQFKAVGGGEFKIPFMADNIGGFKINGTVVAGPRLASSGGGANCSGRNSTEILTSKAPEGLITTVVFQVLKLSFVVANIR